MRIKYYIKLAWKDIKTQPMIYLPYALMVSVCLFFMYIMTYFRVNADYTKLETGRTMVPVVMGWGSCILIILAIILFWTFSITLRRQQTRRQGLYRILGLTRKNLLVLNAVEMMLLCFSSLIFGSLLCVVFGRLMFMLGERFAQQNIFTSFTLNPVLLLVLCMIFLVIHIILILRDSRYIYTHNPLKMLRKEKTQEQPKANMFYTVTGVILLVCAYVYSLSIEDIATSLIGIFIAIFMVIAATYFLYNGIVIYILIKLQKKETIYYKSKHMLSISNLLFRLKTYATSMASITILLTMLIITFSMCFSLYKGGESIAKSQFTDYEYDIRGVEETINYEEYNENEILPLSEERLQSLINKHHLKVKDDIKTANIGGTNSVLLRDNTVWIGAVYPSTHYSSEDENGNTVDGYEDNGMITENDTTIGLIPTTLSSYNSVKGEHLSLKDDEVLLLTSLPVKEVNVRMMLPDKKEEIIPLKITCKDEKWPGETADIVMVIPDNKVKQYDAYLYGNYTSYDEQVDYTFNNNHLMNFIGNKKDKLAFSNELQMYATYCKDYYTFSNEIMSVFGSFFYMGILFCIIFILSIFLILFYRMQEDLYENKRQFSILYRIGLTRKEIGKQFAREQRIIIMAPPVLAILHCLFAYPAFHLFSVLFGFGESGFTLSLLGTGGLIVLAVFAIYHIILQMALRRKILVK